MSTSDRRQAEDLFHRAMEVRPAARAAFVEEACAGNARLRREVEDLLGLTSRNLGTFLEPQSPPLDSTLPRGTRIDAWTIEEVIGEGGFSTVYRAREESPVRREVALKVLRPRSGSRTFLRRFEIERQALVRMDHEGIARILSAGETPLAGLPFIVMELVRGTTILEYCRAARMPRRDMIELFVRVCDAVQHAHQKGVIHRDLKPSNILVSEANGKPQPKIIDFGIAKASDERLTEETFHTEAGLLLGTPRYMSPEQADGDDDVDTRSDIYSLGVILYELLSGAFPYEIDTQTPFDIPRRIREETAVTLSRHDRSLRGDLETIVHVALAKERTRRYASVSDFSADLRRFLSGDAIEARRDRVFYVLGKALARHRVLAAATCLIFLVLLVSSLVMFRLYGDARESGDLASLRYESLRRSSYAQSIAMAQLHSRDGSAYRMIEALDACPEDLRSWEWSYLKRLSDSSLTTYEGWGDISVAPAGDTIAAVGRDNVITIRDLASGAVLRTLEGHTSIVSGMAHSPDGKVLISGSHDGSVRIWDLESGGRTAVLEKTHDQVTDVNYSADGSRFVSCGYDLQVRVWDATTRDLLETYGGHESYVRRATWLPDGRVVSGGYDGRIWIRRPGAEVDDLELLGHTGGILTLQPSADGTRLYSGGWDNSWRIWDTTSGALLRTFDGLPGRVDCVRASPDGETVAVTTGSVIQIWDVRSEQVRHTLIGHRQQVHSCVFIGDSTLASASKDMEVKLWDASRDPRFESWNLGSPLRAIDIEPGGYRLACALEDGSVRVLDLENRAEPLTVGEHPRWATSVVWHRGRVVSCGMEGVLSVWGAGGGEAVLTLPHRRAELQEYDLARSPDGSVLVTLDADGHAVAWRDSYEEPWFRSARSFPTALGAVIAPDLEGIAVYASDGDVWTGSITDGSAWRQHAGHGGMVYHGVFSRDSRRLLTCSADFTARLWDPLETEADRVFEASQEIIKAVGWSPDGRRVLSAGWDCQTTLRDIDSGKPVLMLRGHEEAVQAFCFTPDGALVTGSRDGTVRRWRTLSR